MITTRDNKESRLHKDSQHRAKLAGYDEMAKAPPAESWSRSCAQGEEMRQMYGSRFTEAIEMGAITPREVNRCRRSVRIGQSFQVADMAWKSDRGQGKRPIMDGKVIAKYKHLVTLDCGTSVTYIQILQQRRRGRRYID